MNDSPNDMHIPLFDTAYDTLICMQQCEVQELSDDIQSSPDIKQYGRIFTAPGKMDLETMTRMMNFIQYAGIEEYLDGERPQVRRILNESGFSFDSLHEEDDTSHFLMSANEKDALKYISPEKVAKKLWELKNLVLGGKLERDWKDIGDPDSGGQAKLGDGEDPIYAKEIPGDSLNTVECAIGYLVEHYHLDHAHNHIAVAKSESGDLFLLMNKSTLQRLQSQEYVSQVAVSPVRLGVDLSNAYIA